MPEPFVSFLHHDDKPSICERLRAILKDAKPAYTYTFKWPDERVRPTRAKLTQFEDYLQRVRAGLKKSA
jgi:hypothetical protein